MECLVAVACLLQDTRILYMVMKNGPKIKTETEFFDRLMIEIKIILGPIISDKNNT